MSEGQLNFTKVEIFIHQNAVIATGPFIRSGSTSVEFLLFSAL